MQGFTKTYHRLLGLVLLIAPAVASAADGAETDESAISKFIFNVVPLLLILAFFGLLMRAYNKRHGRYVERARQHMDRLEENTSRIVTELEEIRKEINSPRG